MDAEICQQQRVTRILAYFMTPAQMDSSLDWKVTRLAAGESLRVSLRLQRMAISWSRAVNG
jgi:hypothetical protein